MTITPEPSEERPSAAPTEATGDAGLLAEAERIVDDIAEREFEPEDRASMESLDQPRRLLLVHAHPDDESSQTGATMARYASAGAGVTLVTCTRGERGEIVPDDLQGLRGDFQAVAEHRISELSSAMEALGVEDHRFLDDAPLSDEDAATTAAVHYEDSGMAWEERGEKRAAVPDPDTPPTAFAKADLSEAAARLAGVIREVRPQIVITYEPGGGYGHPDHVRAAEVTSLALDLAADADATGVVGLEPWEVARLFEIVMPMSVMRESTTLDRPTMMVDDSEVDVVIEAPEQLEAKVAALRAHRSQVGMVEEDGEWRIEFSPEDHLVVPTTECFRLGRGSLPQRVGRGNPPASDFFTGLSL